MDVCARLVDRYASIPRFPGRVVSDYYCSASGTSLAAVTVIGLAKFFHTDYTSSSWQIWLVFCAVAFVTSEPFHEYDNITHADCA